MNTYDFNVLSWEEFEEFTKDLLSAEMGIPFESFANGPDGGVDLRHSSNGKKRDIIVQCKRYATAASLLSNLEKELVKLKAMKPKPKRYILSLTHDLSETKVTELVKTFSPYLKSSDIYTPKTLNSLLNKHKEVERRHYKLWLSSSNVLETIVSSTVINFTSLIKEEIADTLKLYSPTPSFGDAMNSLKKNGFIIISGEPGVGKTTLANVMSYYLLGDGDFEELIALPQDIHQAVQMMSANPEKKQLFLFDDFLGANYLDQKLSRGEDSVFRTLFTHISRMKKNKALIMTTREYILNQARQSTVVFQEDDFTNAKYVINLSKYDALTKARILYNHIAASDIPEEYLALFLEKKLYQKVVRHRNYSPRLISSVNQQKPWEGLTPEEFCVKIIDLFDNPWSLYEDVFVNKISPMERDVLLVMASFGRSVQFKYLHRAVVSLNSDFDEIALRKSIDILDGTFLSTSRNSDGNIVVSALNPTIYDFIAHYHKDHSHTLQKLINSAVYLNQVTNLFAITPLEAPTLAVRTALGSREPIVVDSETRGVIEGRIIKDWLGLLWIGTGAEPETFDLLSNAYRLLDGAIVTDKTKELITDDILQELETSEVQVIDIASALSVLEYNIEDEKISDAAAENYANSITMSVSTYEDLSIIAELSWHGGTKETISKMIIDEIVGSDSHIELFEDEIKQRLSDGDDTEAIGEEMEQTLANYGLDVDFVDMTFNAWSEPPEDFDASQFYNSKMDFDIDDRPNPEQSENSAMDDMFGSLKSRF